MPLDEGGKERSDENPTAWEPDCQHCRSSYSHRGGFHTLDELADYDGHGLWSFGDVRFSAAGTLLVTAEAIVSASEAGHSAEELGRVVGVEAKDALRKLSADGRLGREKFGGRFVYCSRDRSRRARQLRTRRIAASEAHEGLPARAVISDDLATAAALVAVLDERQRRLFAGLESLKHGRGGDRLVSNLLGMDPATVAKGRRQLLSGDFENARIRKAAEKNPEIPGLIHRLMEHDTAGDPMGGLLWTRRTTANLAGALSELGITVCDRTAARLLLAGAPGHWLQVARQSQEAGGRLPPRPRRAVRHHRRPARRKRRRSGSGHQRESRFRGFPPEINQVDLEVFWKFGLEDCAECSGKEHSRLGMGDNAILPTRPGRG